MAVRFDGTVGKRMIRTADVLDYNSPYTVSFWFYLAGISGTASPFTIGVNASSTDLWEIRGSRTLELFVAVPAGTSVTGSVINLGQWYHIFIVREAVDSLKLYLDGVLDITNTRDVTARAASTNMSLGAALFGGSYLQEVNGRFANMKIWSADKTANLGIEADTILPQDFTNLYGYYPIFPGNGERGIDYSGNNRDWTEVGALTDEDAPPVGYGSRNAT